MKQTIIIIITLFSVCCGYCTTIDVTTGASPVLPGNSATLNSTNMGTLITNAGPGGVLYFPRGTYNFAATVNDNTGVYFCGESKESVILTKDSANSGAIIAVAPTASTLTGGFKNITFSYSGTNSCSGIIFGSGSYTASNFMVENCDFKNFTLYGLEVYKGLNFFIKDVRVLNHGISGIANSIGFYIGAGGGGVSGNSNAKISNVYSEIDLNNASTTSTAIKLQTTSTLVADNIQGKDGALACVSLDSLLSSSKINNLTIEAKELTSNPGLLIKALAGSSYMLNGVRSIGSFSKSIDIVGNSGNVSCAGLTLMNVSTDSVLAESNAVIQSCKFINITCNQFQLAPSASSSATGNQFVGITVSSGDFMVNVYSSLFDNIRAINAGTIAIAGDSNNINNCYSESSSDDALTIDGNNYNTVINCHVKNPANYPLWSKTGTSFIKTFFYQYQPPKPDIYNGNITYVNPKISYSF